jgi:N-acetylglucosaminyl-diphospho-decaprenol L-rhamnosyltransferase
VHDPKIVVVIVTYKCAPLTVACLASIDSERARAGARVDVVVVDNASGDGPEIQNAVEQRGWGDWVTVSTASKNGGFAYGNNWGIRLALQSSLPKYFYLLNPDTEIRPNSIRALVDFLELHPEVGIAGSSFETEDGREWPYAFRFPTLVSEIEQGMQLGMVTKLLSRWTVARSMGSRAEQTDWISGASMMIRREVFVSAGCLDENFFLYFEETEFCHRARRAGFATWYVPQSRVMHMIGKSTNLNDDGRFLKRLPGYWFDSRRRYYQATGSHAAAIAIDMAAVLASTFGLLKRILQRRASTPHYIRDLIAHSAVWRRNRRIAPLETFFPPA